MTLAFDGLLAPRMPTVRMVAAPWPDPETLPDPERVALAMLEPRDLLDPKTLHAELASAWNLPDYYGRNWDALADVLSDVGTYGSLTARVLIVYEAEHVVRHAAPQLDLLAGIIQAIDAQLRGTGKCVRLVLVGS